jgi:hypothetical protein
VIADAIRNTDTQQNIYVLLTGYLEVMQGYERRKILPEYVTRLPISGRADVMARFKKLVAGLDLASKRLDDEACVVIKDALVVFSTAFDRLDAEVDA